METAVMSPRREAFSQAIEECDRAQVAIARARALCTVATWLCLTSRPSTHFSRLRGDIGGTPIRALVRRDGSIFAERSWLERTGRQMHSCPEPNESPDPLIATFVLSRSCDRLDDVELLDAGCEHGPLMRGASARAGDSAWTISCTIVHKGDVDLVQMSGELDLAGWSRIERTLGEITAPEVRLDISGLSFIDARGFSILQEAKNHLTQNGHVVTVCGENECAHSVQRAIALMSSVSSSTDSSAARPSSTNDLVTEPPPV
jgi:anti-anti-sigma factor